MEISVETKMRNKRVQRIAIVGAGVAGLTLAIIASKKGYEVSIFERGAKVASMGAGVTLWSNAMFVLEQMGLAKTIKKLGAEPKVMYQFDQGGKQQGELNIEAVNAISGYSSVTILRRDLMATLANALEALGINIHFNTVIEAEDIKTLDQDFDLVVGADGRMNSVVRKSLFEEIKPSYQGFINIIGISPFKSEDQAQIIQDYRGLGERFGIVPVKTGLCYWAAGWATPLNKERPLSSWYEEMHQRFLHWPKAVQDVLSGYEEIALNRIFVHDLEPLPYWHHGKTLIIGDAAHAPLPTSGQGACQAIEDAWHLVRLLEENTNLENALTCFYQSRSMKTSAAQKVGRQLAQSIFSTGAETVPITSQVSAKQLSEFWMQGLKLNG